MAKFHHVGKYLEIFGNIFKVYLVLGKVLNSLVHNLYAIGQIFIAENGQILKTQFGHLVTLSANATNNFRTKIPFPSRNQNNAKTQLTQRCSVLVVPK